MEVLTLPEHIFTTINRNQQQVIINTKNFKQKGRISKRVSTQKLNFWIPDENEDSKGHSNPPDTNQKWAKDHHSSCS